MREWKPHLQNRPFRTFLKHLLKRCSESTSALVQSFPRHLRKWKVRGNKLGLLSPKPVCLEGTHLFSDRILIRLPVGLMAHMLWSDFLQLILLHWRVLDNDGSTHPPECSFALEQTFFRTSWPPLPKTGPAPALRPR